MPSHMLAHWDLTELQSQFCQKWNREPANQEPPAHHWGRCPLKESDLATANLLCACPSSSCLPPSACHQPSTLNSSSEHLSVCWQNAAWFVNCRMKPIRCFGFFFFAVIISIFNILTKLLCSVSGHSRSTMLWKFQVSSEGTRPHLSSQQRL